MSGQSLDLTYNILPNDDVANLLKIRNSDDLNKRHLFVQIPSEVRIDCDFENNLCHLLQTNSEPSPSPKILENLNVINEKFDVYYIYDLNINNYTYKYTNFLLPKTTPKTSSKKKNSLVFNNSEIVKAISEELNKISKTYPIKNLIFGTELNLYFSLIPNYKAQQEEILAFWKTLKSIKDKNNDYRVSTSLMYEHMRGMNFWSKLGRERMPALDFFAVSSAPLSIGWKTFDKFFNQMYFADTSRLDVLERYYQGLDFLTSMRKEIVLTGLRFPMEKKDPYELKKFVEHSNFRSYFPYIPVVLRTAAATSQYDTKTIVKDSNTIEELINL